MVLDTMETDASKIECAVQGLYLSCSHALRALRADVGDQIPADLY